MSVLPYLPGQTPPGIDSPEAPWNMSPFEVASFLASPETADPSLKGKSIEELERYANEVLSEAGAMTMPRQAKLLQEERRIFKECFQDAEILHTRSLVAALDAS